MAGKVENGAGRVVVADALDPSAVALLRQSFEVVDVSKEPAKLGDAIGTARGLIVRSRTQVDNALFEKAPRLEVVGRAGVGVDNIDVLAAHRKGVIVVNAPGAAAASVAELTVGLLIAVARDFDQHIPSLKQGRWTKGTNGFELQGRMAGIVGYGRIGREVGKRFRALGMGVQAYDPYVQRTDDGTALVSFDQLLASSDVVSVHAALAGSGEHLFAAETFGKMRKGAVLLNVARGKFVNEGDLLAAIDSGQLYGAGLDVFEDEPPKNQKLLQHPHVVAVPHIGASTSEAQERAGRTVVEDVVRVLRGESPEFPVHV